MFQYDYNVKGGPRICQGSLSTVRPCLVESNPTVSLSDCYASPQSSGAFHYCTVFEYLGVSPHARIWYGTRPGSRGALPGPDMHTVPTTITTVLVWYVVFPKPRVKPRLAGILGEGLWLASCSY